VKGETFIPGLPEPWTDLRFLAGQPDRYFDLHPDGQRVMLRLATGGAPDHVVLVTNFFDQLRRLSSERSLGVE